MGLELSSYTSMVLNVKGDGTKDLETNKGARTHPNLSFSFGGHERSLILMLMCT